ncbi:MAG: TPM domain-containing protein [Candidatus Coatesbacteria bacterium]
MVKPPQYGTGGSRTSSWITVGFVLLLAGAVVPWGKVPALWHAVADRGPVIPPRPAIRVWVNDFAGVIDEGTRGRIAALLEAHERATSNEVVVVTVPSLRGLTRQEFANRLFNDWGIGKKGKNNGVLLLVATGEHEAQFEVGYGLEPVLTDGRCGEITRQDMIPHFKRGDYPAGILAGMIRVTGLLGSPQPAAPAAPAAPSSPGPAGPSGVRVDGMPTSFAGLAGLAAFIGLFIAIGAFLFGAGFGSQQVFLIVFGAFFGGMPLAAFSTVFLLRAPGGLPFYVAHLVLAVVLVRLGYRSGRAHPAAFRSGTRGGSGWSWGGGSGGGGGGFGGGGGGGFGGGSSGGGGGGGSW